jgi:hypothetical protein
MFGATVPKTPIDENSDLPARENDIGYTTRLLEDLVINSVT